MLGLDETRFGRPRWVPAGVGADGRTRWVSTDPWETGFVDLVGGQGLLGQVDGRTSAAVQGWLAGRSQGFRDAVQVVVIDPHASYAAAVRAALPGARIAVDHFHLIMLANRAVTAVRQRVTPELLGRRGRAADPAWANRRLLLRGHERLRAGAGADVERLRRPRPVGADPVRADREGGTPRAVCHRRHRRAPSRDQRPVVELLPLVRRRRHPRDHHPGRDHRGVVARHRGLPQHRAHQRPHRGHASAHQAGETRRLRIQKPRQLPPSSTVALHSINTNQTSVLSPLPGQDRRAG